MTFGLKYVANTIMRVYEAFLVSFFIVTGKFKLISTTFSSFNHEFAMVLLGIVFRDQRIRNRVFPRCSPLVDAVVWSYVFFC